MPVYSDPDHGLTELQRLFKNDFLPPGGTEDFTAWLKNRSDIWEKIKLIDTPRMDAEKLCTDDNSKVRFIDLFELLEGGEGEHKKTCMGDQLKAGLNLFPTVVLLLGEKVGGYRLSGLKAGTPEEKLSYEQRDAIRKIVFRYVDSRMYRLIIDSLGSSVTYSSICAALFLDVRGFERFITGKRRNMPLCDQKALYKYLLSQLDVTVLRAYGRKYRWRSLSGTDFRDAYLGLRDVFKNDTALVKSCGKTFAEIISRLPYATRIMQAIADMEDLGKDCKNFTPEQWMEAVERVYGVSFDGDEEEPVLTPEERRKHEEWIEETESTPHPIDIFGDGEEYEVFGNNLYFSKSDREQINCDIIGSYSKFRAGQFTLVPDASVPGGARLSGGNFSSLQKAAIMISMYNACFDRYGIVKRELFAQAAALNVITGATDFFPWYYIRPREYKSIGEFVKAALSQAKLPEKDSDDPTFVYIRDNFDLLSAFEFSDIYEMLRKAEKLSPRQKEKLVKTLEKQIAAFPEGFADSLWREKNYKKLFSGGVVTKSFEDHSDDYYAVTLATAHFILERDEMMSREGISPEPDGEGRIAYVLRRVKWTQTDWRIERAVRIIWAYDKTAVREIFEECLRAVTRKAIER